MDIDGDGIDCLAAMKQLTEARPTIFLLILTPRRKGTFMFVERAENDIMGTPLPTTMKEIIAVSSGFHKKWRWGLILSSLPSMMALQGGVLW